MVARRALGDPEVGRDLAVSEALRDEDNHLALATGEMGSGFAGRWIPGHRRRGWIDLIPGESVIGGLVERHRPPLGQSFFPLSFLYQGAG